jgi:5-methylcytosine-specific restriction endonuclease McrA
MNDCLNCGKPVIGKYCNNKCQSDYQIGVKKKKFLDGFYVGKRLQFRANEWTRKLLIEHKGLSCTSCNITDWNGKPILLEVNHIDGKAYNNIIENLEFLCPNCHSQTDTYKAKNTNSDRTYRKPV